MFRVSSFLLTGFAALALSATAAQAVTISVTGDTGGPRGVGTTGQLQVIIDIAPEGNTFTNGGLALSVTNSQPGVIAFTGAEVVNQLIFGSLVWSIVGTSGVSDDQIEELFAASVSTQALNPFLPGNPIVDGGTEFLFATIDYTVVGGGGTSVQVEVGARLDPVISGGVDVSDTLNFIPSEPIVGIPEPTSMALFGLGLTALGLVRRR